MGPVNEQRKRDLPPFTDSIRSFIGTTATLAEVNSLTARIDCLETYFLNDGQDYPPPPHTHTHTTPRMQHRQSPSVTKTERTEWEDVTVTAPMRYAKKRTTVYRKGKGQLKGNRTQPQTERDRAEEQQVERRRRSGCDPVLGRYGRFKASVVKFHHTWSVQGRGLVANGLATSMPPVRRRTTRGLN